MADPYFMFKFRQSLNVPGEFFPPVLADIGEFGGVLVAVLPPFSEFGGSPMPESEQESLCKLLLCRYAL